MMGSSDLNVGISELFFHPQTEDEFENTIKKKCRYFPELTDRPAPPRARFSIWPPLEGCCVANKTCRMLSENHTVVMVNMYSFKIGTKGQTYNGTAADSPFRNVFDGDGGLQFFGWQRVDNRERSQTRDESEERETHCDQVGNRMSRGGLECLVD